MNIPQLTARVIWVNATLLRRLKMKKQRIRQFPPKTCTRLLNDQVLAVTERETLSSPTFQKQKVVGGRGHVRSHILVSSLFSLGSAKTFSF